MDFFPLLPQSLWKFEGGKTLKIGRQLAAKWDEKKWNATAAASSLTQHIGLWDSRAVEVGQEALSTHMPWPWPRPVAVGGTEKNGKTGKMEWMGENGTIFAHFTWQTHIFCIFYILWPPMANLETLIPVFEWAGFCHFFRVKWEKRMKKEKFLEIGFLFLK